MHRSQIVALVLIPTLGIATHQATPAESTLAGCAIRLPARPGQAAQELTTLDVLVGSPEGSEGRISPLSDQVDQAGKHWRDVYPLAGASPVFLACRYGRGAIVRMRVPESATRCELDYHYVSHYDTKADRVFCQ